MPDVELPALYVDTLASSDTSTRPIVLNRDPGPGESGVPRTAAIVLELMDPGLEGIERHATRVRVDGELAWSGEVPGAEVQAPFSGPRATTSESPHVLHIVLDPVSPWESLATVEVEVQTQTLGGEHTLETSYAFRIEDRTPPKMVVAHAVAARRVRVGFDEQVVVGPTGQFRLSARTPASVPVGVLEALEHGDAVELVLTRELTPGALYRVEAIEVADPWGNRIDPAHAYSDFLGFVPIRPSDRRFLLREMLPNHLWRDDTTGDLGKLIACFQEVLDLLLAEVDRFITLVDIDRMPEPFVDVLLCDLGNPFAFELREPQKRRLASVLVALYHQKGTAAGILNALRLFLGLEDVAIVPFTSTTLTLGVSELGVDFELGPSDRFARYAFNVEVGHRLEERTRAQIREVVETLKPVSTHFVDLIEPQVPEIVEHWELGRSALDTETALHA